MKFGITIGNHRFSLGLHHLVRREGICSKVGDTDKHILLADFDDCDIDTVVRELKWLQDEYDLPTIHILKTKERGYHAYCFCYRDFGEILRLLAQLPSVDRGFVGLGVVRGYWTLRITPKRLEDITPLVRLESDWPPEVDVFDSLRVTKYWTTNRG